MASGLRLFALCSRCLAVSECRLWLNKSETDVRERTATVQRATTSNTFFDASRVRKSDMSRQSARPTATWHLSPLWVRLILESPLEKHVVEDGKLAE